MLKGFREFVMRGNVIDLAIAVVIGAAFGRVSVNGSKIVYGSTITALINLLIVAGVIYFVIVLPLTPRCAASAMRRSHRRRPTRRSC